VSSSLIRQDLVPMTAGFALVMATLAVGLGLLRRDQRTAASGTGREPSTADGPSTAEGPAGPGVGRPGGRGWLRLIRTMGATFVGGYVILMIVVVAYYFGVARVSNNFLQSAFTGCAELLGLSAPVFLALSWQAQWRDRRHLTRRRHRFRLPSSPQRAGPARPPDREAARPRDHEGQG
jgi:Family of unknown function (DUF6256)